MQMAIAGTWRLRKRYKDFFNRLRILAVHRQRDPFIQIAIPFIFHVAERELTEGEVALVSEPVSLRVWVSDEFQTKMPAHARMNWRFIFRKWRYEQFPLDPEDCIITGPHCCEELCCQRERNSEFRVSG